MSSRGADAQVKKRAAGVLIAMFLVATASQAWVHFGGAGETLKRARASGRFDTMRELVAPRGKILASDGRILAQSLDVFQLSVRYDQVPESPSFFLALSAASGIPSAELSAALATGGERRYWPEPLSAARADKVREVKRHWFADGVSLDRVQRRVYPYADVLGTLVGRYEADLVTGLESSQNRVLSGENGSQSGLADRRGESIDGSALDEWSERRVTWHRALQ